MATVVGRELRGVSQDCAGVHAPLQPPRRDSSKYAESRVFYSVSGALKELAAPADSEPFYEVLRFVEQEGSRLASVTAPERDMETSTEGARELLRAEERISDALQQQG